MSVANATQGSSTAAHVANAPFVSALVVSHNAVSCGQIDQGRLEAIFAAPVPVTFEIVAIDNGSEDGSGEVLAAWSKRFPRLIAGYLDRRVPLVQAIGKAADAASGELVLLVDIDETDHLLLLGDLVERLRGHDGLHGIRAARPPSTGRFLSGIFNLFCRAALGFRMHDLGHHHFLLPRSTFDRLRAEVEAKRLFAYTYAIERLRIDVVETPVPYRPAGRSSYGFARRASYVSRAVFEAARTRWV